MDDRHTPVVLTVDRLDANRRLCSAGTRISPSVDGWPAHRVALALQHGYAKSVDESIAEPTVVPGLSHVKPPQPTVAVQSAPLRLGKKKKKHGGQHGL